MRRCVIGALAVVAAAACGGDDAGPANAGETVVPQGFELDSVTIAPGDLGESVELDVWIADDADERRQGLMEVTDLGEASGMLFVFEDEATRRFHMWRTVMPLSIAFFDADGEFVGAADMQPCEARTSASCPRYTVDVPFLRALEVPAGSLEELGISDGATLELTNR